MSSSLGLVRAEKNSTSFKVSSKTAQMEYFYHTLIQSGSGL